MCGFLDGLSYAILQRPFSPNLPFPESPLDLPSVLQVQAVLAVAGCSSGRRPAAVLTHSTPRPSRRTHSNRKMPLQNFLSK